MISLVCSPSLGGLVRIVPGVADNSTGVFMSGAGRSNPGYVTGSNNPFSAMWGLLRLVVETTLGLLGYALVPSH